MEAISVPSPPKFTPSKSCFKSPEKPDEGVLSVVVSSGKYHFSRGTCAACAGNAVKWEGE